MADLVGIIGRPSGLRGSNGEEAMIWERLFMDVLWGRRSGCNDGGVRTRPSFLPCLSGGAEGRCGAAQQGG